MNTYKLLLYMLISILFTNLSNSQTWKQLYDSTNAYMQKQDYQVALEWGEKALAQAEKEFGKLDTNYAKTVTLIVELNYYNGSYEKGIEYAKLDSALRIKINGENHPDYAGSLNNLANVYLNIKKFVEAEPLLKDAIKIYKEQFGEDSPN